MITKPLSKEINNATVYIAVVEKPRYAPHSHITVRMVVTTHQLQMLSDTHFVADARLPIA